MSNPRPCKCGHPRTWHVRDAGACFSPGTKVVDLCLRYRPAKRTEPLRAVRRDESFYRTADAMRTGKTSGHFWHRRLDEMEPPPVTREEVRQIVQDEVRRIVDAAGDRRPSFYAEPVTLRPSGASLRASQPHVWRDFDPHSRP